MDIFTDKDDRILFLEILGDISERFEVEICTYILMNNHYHLLFKSRKPNISKACKARNYVHMQIQYKNNQEIVSLFGLGSSSISRRVSIMKSKMSKEVEINKRLEELKPLIKVPPILNT